MTATLSPLRTDRITASRLPSVLDISPTTTPTELLREMVREHFGDEPEFTGNIVTEWGTNHEADVIAEYELTRGVQVHRYGKDQQTLVHRTYDFLAATPDGIIKDRVVECKAPWRARYTTLKERPDYEAQIRLQMECAGRRFGDLAIWRPNQPLTVETVEFDSDWLPSVLPKVEEFLAEYFETVADPVLYTPHREPLKDVRTDTEWAVAATEWKELDFMIRQLSTERDQAAAELERLSPDKPARGAGLDLLRYERRGNVQYRKVLAEFGIKADLEKYRGATIPVTSIRRVGGRKDK